MAVNAEPLSASTSSRKTYRTFKSIRHIPKGNADVCNYIRIKIHENPQQLSRFISSPRRIDCSNPSNSVNMSSNPQPTSSSGAADRRNSYGHSEAEAAEAALAYNEALQTTSAGRPQPTTPQRIPSNHYVGAALQLGANSHLPPPLQGQGSTDSATSAGQEEDAAAAAPPLSRGTTRAVQLYQRGRPATIPDAAVEDRRRKPGGDLRRREGALAGTHVPDRSRATSPRHNGRVGKEDDDGALDGAGGGGGWGVF